MGGEEAERGRGTASMRGWGSPGRGRLRIRGTRVWGGQGGCEGVGSTYIVDGNVRGEHAAVGTEKKESD